jgi:Zn-dependent protease with chaperone function
MGDEAPIRYGQDPGLDAIRRRSRWRAALSVVVGAVASAPFLFYAALFAGVLVWAFAAMAVRSPLAAVLIVVVVTVAVLVVRSVERDSWSQPGWDKVGKHLPAVSDLEDDHPAVQAMHRLAALGGIEAPRLQRVSSPGMNACVAIARGHTAIRLTDGALDGLTGPQLEAVLAHELFHLAHGDVRSAARWESAASLAGDDSTWTGRFVLAGVRELLRARELAADRAAVLLTGRPSALIEAIEVCAAQRGDIPDEDLRVVGASAFVADEESASGPLATHPSTQDRLEVVARVAAQLGQRRRPS